MTVDEARARLEAQGYRLEANTNFWVREDSSPGIAWIVAGDAPDTRKIAYWEPTSIEAIAP